MKRSTTFIVLAAVGCGGAGKDAAEHRAARPVWSAPSNPTPARASNDADEAAQATRELSEKRSPQAKESRLDVGVLNAYFDAKASLLSFTVTFYVRRELEKSIYLVAQNCAFPHVAPGNNHFFIYDVEQHGDEWIIDLSWPTPVGPLGKNDGLEFAWYPVLEIRSAHVWAYSFQFPLTADSGYSHFRGEERPVPHGKVRIRLKFGYGEEPVMAFIKRERRDDDTAEVFLRRILDKWQTTVMTEPVTIDFSGGGVDKE